MYVAMGPPPTPCLEERSISPCITRLHFYFAPLSKPSASKLSLVGSEGKGSEWSEVRTLRSRLRPRQIRNQKSSPCNVGHGGPSRTCTPAGPSEVWSFMSGRGDISMAQAPETDRAGAKRQKKASLASKRTRWRRYQRKRRRFISCLLALLIKG